LACCERGAGGSPKLSYQRVSIALAAVCGMSETHCTARRA